MDQGGKPPQPPGLDGQQEPQSPQQHPIPQVPPQPVPPIPMAMNWYYFKAKFSGKPEEDPGAHILRIIDWMDTHNFVVVQRVRRFPLILTGRLGYGVSVNPFQGNWEELQESFRTQFSKTGNAREQLFHAWRSFHFDENAETVDACVPSIRQVAAMIKYGMPQILNVFENTVPSHFIGHYLQLRT